MGPPILSARLRAAIGRSLPAVLCVLLVLAVVVYSGLLGGGAGGAAAIATAADELALVEKRDANVVRLTAGKGPLPGSDKRGWILSPLHMAAHHGLGGATACLDVHVGTIRAGLTRANHRHHAKNESFLIWGAAARWRLENPELTGGYAEAEFDKDEVAVFTAPKGRGHALVNLDSALTLNLMVCADATWNPAAPDTDYKVWSDL